MEEKNAGQAPEAEPDDEAAEPQRETEDSLYEKLMSLQFLLMDARRRAFSGVRPEANPTEGQGRVIAFLKIKDGVSTKDLARVLGVGMSSINETLTKMERAGLVERRKSERDGRVMLVWLTDKGRAVETAEPARPDLFAGFSQEELDQFGTLLDRVIANIGDESGENFADAFEERAEALRKVFGDRFGERRPGDFGGMPGGFGGFGGMPGGFGAFGGPWRKR